MSISLVFLYSSSFGFPLVCCLKGKVIVPANKVLAASPQPRQIMETAIATLMHLALQSEIIEMEVILLHYVIVQVSFISFSISLGSCLRLARLLTIFNKNVILEFDDCFFIPAGCFHDVCHLSN